ncbi:hypothetical protein [Nocardioides dongxiaopingii]|uniref:hypothetical protein n=1 Tax=Nocardioides dongxiaopingii TaxID=2576036 RepID=UPI0010C76339|nr:hypothetical protein [Nocardioides dongxiaopingii]
MPASLPAFRTAARLRPVDVVQPGSRVGPAPFVAAERDLAAGRPAPADVVLRSGRTTFRATWDGVVVALEVGDATGGVSRHVSRRHGHGVSPTTLALALTGPFLAAFVREAGTWVARAVVDLTLLPGAPDVHDEDWLAGLSAEGERTGTFGQLGFRDVRTVTHADGTAHLDGDRVLLTATSAGPGGFRTGHTSVWALDPLRLEVEHRADLFFRRPERPGTFGDHATHLVRDGDRWLVATSTWGDFDKRTNPRVTTTLATETADVDLLHGHHVLDTVPLDLPVEGLDSVGRWDPHLVRADGGWLATYVSARRFFSFHPVLAQGRDLDRLRLRAAATDRTATEGPTLTRLGEEWAVLASDGRDNPRGRRAAYPVYDLDLRQRGTLDADYPTNIPWPTLVPRPGGPAVVGFDGTPAGGPLLDYGTHGDLVVQLPVVP